MAPITHADKFTTDLDADAVRTTTIDWFKGYTYKIEADEPNFLVVYTGSQVKMRLLGGAFIADSSLPTRTTIELAPSGPGTTVTVSAQESIGVGAKMGMRGKYQRWLAQITSGLRATCSGAPSG